MSERPPRGGSDDDQRPDDSTQPSLPLDFDVDEAVPYRLTARAMRVVAPGSLPALRVVPADGDHVPADLDDPHDPRSARARALRRAGVPVEAIAEELDVDVVVVRSWIREIGAAPRRLRPLPALPRDPRHHPQGDGLAHHAGRFTDARAAAAVEAPARLTSPDFTRGLALTVAAADVDAHALVVTAREQAVASTIVRWLVDHADAPLASVRVVLRLGDVHGADLTVHRWAEVLQVSPQQVSRTRWPAAPSAEAVEALIRVADAEVAGRVAGWGAVLLGTPDLDRADHDLAF